MEVCRRLAAGSRNANDGAFLLELVEGWQAVESRSARRHCLRHDSNVGNLQEHSPGRGGQAAGASPALAEQHSQPLGRLR
jgi:hypothetical protein